MRQTLRIARTEFACLFHSPVAWFILIVFSVLTFKDFTDLLSSTAAYVAQLPPDAAPGSLTQTIFCEMCGKMVHTLFIYLPLLTMGLMARETSSGSIKLLESSPVRPVQIITGKYLAVLCVCLLMMAVPLVCAVTLSAVLPHMDWALSVSAMSAVFLLMGVYCAIGLFMSTVTSYQMVAALLTIIVLAALNFMDRVFQEYDLVRNITYWLSMTGRTGNLMGGYVRAEDVCYFLIVSLMFLAFAVVLLENRRHSRGILRRSSGYVAVAAAALLLGFFSTRIRLNSDVTASGSNSLSEGTLEVLASLDGPVTVTEYVNLLDNASFPHLPINRQKSQPALSRLALHRRDISTRHCYYYRQNGRMGGRFFSDKTEEQLRDIFTMMYHTNPRLYVPADMLPEKDFLESRGFSYCALIRDASGHEAVLHDFADMEKVPSEVELTTLLRSLEVPPVRVAFAVSEDERPLVGVSEKSMDAFTVQESARCALVNMGFEIVQTELGCGTIPDSAGILVISDPLKPLSPAAVDEVLGFVGTGGSLLVLADRTSSASLRDLLAGLGVAVKDGVAAMCGTDTDPSLVVSVSAECSGAPVKRTVTMPYATTLEVTDTADFTCLPLLQTRTPVVMTTRKAMETEGFVAEGGSVEMTACALEGRARGSGRVIVVSDADCMSNAELSIVRDGIDADNYGFITDCFYYLSGSEYPVRLQAPVCRDTFIRAGAPCLAWTRFCLVVLLPLLLAAAAVADFIIRRRN